MSALTSLENSLNDIFGKQAPALPKNVKAFIVKYLPWLTLFIAILSILSIYSLWYWAYKADEAATFVNELNSAYGVTDNNLDRLSTMVWVSLIILSVQTALYLLAFQPLRELKKQGWDLLFYAALVNLVYGVAVLFTAYGTFGNLVGTIIGSAVGFYFLFQIRASYLGHKKPANTVSSKKST